MRVFWGTVWTAINEVKAPFTFDIEDGIALHEMQGNRSFFGVRRKNHGFTQVAAGTWGIF